MLLLLLPTIFPTASLLGSQHRFTPTTCDPTIRCLSPRLFLKSSEAICLSFNKLLALKSLIPLSALSSFPVNFLHFLPLLPAQIDSPNPCRNTSLVLASIFFYTFSTFPSLCILFYPSGSLYLLFPFTRWKTTCLTCFLAVYLSQLLRLKVF